MLWTFSKAAVVRVEFVNVQLPVMNAAKRALVPRRSFKIGIKVLETTLTLRLHSRNPEAYSCTGCMICHCSAALLTAWTSSKCFQFPRQAYTYAPQHMYVLHCGHSFYCWC